MRNCPIVQFPKTTQNPRWKNQVAWGMEALIQERHFYNEHLINSGEFCITRKSKSLCYSPSLSQESTILNTIQ